VYKTRITDLNDLKHRIRMRTEWAKLYHTIIAAAVYQWRRHLLACVRAGGGHFEPAFNFDIVFFAITMVFEAFVH